MLLVVSRCDVVTCYRSLKWWPMPTYDAATTNKCSSLTQLGGSFQYVPICSHDIPYMCSAEVPEYLAPAQEQGAIMIGVTGYPGPSCCLSMSTGHLDFRNQWHPLATTCHNLPPFAVEVLESLPGSMPCDGFLRPMTLISQSFAWMGLLWSRKCTGFLHRPSAVMGLIPVRFSS